MDANTIIENYLFDNEFENLKDYEGFYKINKKGELWSCIYKKIMSPHDKEGYLYIHLTKNTKKFHTSIHRLLAIQYIPNPDNLPEVDHIDRNRANNNLDNLRWVDKSVQNNNKSNCIHLKTEEEHQKRIEDIKEYKRLWAENKRRENGIQIKEKIKTADEKEYKKLKQREYRANKTEEDKKAELEERRQKYAQKEQTDTQKEAAKERARKQREAVKEDPEKAAQMKEYKRLKAKEYRDKKKEQEQNK